MLLRPQLTPTPQEMIDEADRDGDGEVSQDQLLLHLLLHLLLLLLQLLLLLPLLIHPPPSHFVSNPTPLLR